MDNHKPIKTITFSQLITRQLLKTALTSMAVALFVSILVGTLLLHLTAKSQINSLKQLTEYEIDKHLATGWTKDNLQKVYANLKHSYPNEQFYLIRNQKFRKNGIKLPDALEPVLSKIESTQAQALPVTYHKGYVVGGYPIFVKPECLACHSNDRRYQVGSHAGTLLFYSPLSTFQLSTASIFVFILIFMITGTITAYLDLQKQFKRHLTKPIENLINRVHSVRLDDDEVAWKATQNQIQEVAEIDQAIGNQIEKIRHMHQKLDALLVTEHETGLFHKDRFTEALKFEVYRAERYDRPFSILLVKLLRIHTHDKQNDATKSEKIGYFAEHLNHCIRNSDMGFRITEQLFAILLPETDEKAVINSECSVINRFDNFESRLAEKAPELGLDHHFEVVTGYATYKVDALNASELTKIALGRLKEKN